MIAIRASATAILALLPVLASAQPPVPKNGFRAEFLRDLDNVQKKIIDLATAMPAEKYAWRPAAGVRSVSEVYMHIAGGNYFLASFGRRNVWPCGSRTSTSPAWRCWFGVAKVERTE